MKPFDNYEIHGVHEIIDDGRTFSEQVPDDEAMFWTLYGHIPGEGVQAIGDFAKREDAEEVFQRITGIPFAGTCHVAARLRVMQAGPKLLEALERAEFLMRRVAKGDHQAFGNLADAAGQARAAIALARGRAA